MKKAIQIWKHIAVSDETKKAFDKLKAKTGFSADWLLDYLIKEENKRNVK